MQKIKTEQPYKLYRNIIRESPKAKNRVILLIILLLFVIVLTIVDFGLYQLWSIGLIIICILIYLPFQLYDPKLKAEYEPEVSYKQFRDYKSNQSKLPKVFRDEDTLMRMDYHQDIDFNVKVDLNAIFGVNDKLVISYQNFGYEKEKMEDGDYLLGVSPHGVYYVIKNQTITKTKINFNDIDTIGILAVTNIYVIHLISKQNDEINIIIDQIDSLLVSPVMLFNRMLKLLDDYILNGGAISNSASRRRRVSVSSDASTENGSGSTTTEFQEATNNRVIDISYSTGVLEEMRTATDVGSNRKIEL